MATNHFAGEESFLPSLDDVNAELQEKYADVYGPDQDYRPNLTVAFYSFRIMMGLGFLMLGVSLLGFWLIRGDKNQQVRGLG